MGPISAKVVLFLKKLPLFGEILPFITLIRGGSALISTGVSV